MVLDLDHRIPEHAYPYAGQQQPKRKRGGVFEAVVAVGVAFVGFGLGMGRDEKHKKVRDQIRQRVNTVGDQAG
jgi:hypothetical protein